MYILPCPSQYLHSFECNRRSRRHYSTSIRHPTATTWSPKFMCTRGSNFNALQSRLRSNPFFGSGFRVVASFKLPSYRYGRSITHALSLARNGAEMSAERLQSHHCIIYHGALTIVIHRWMIICHTTSAYVNLAECHIALERIDYSMRVTTSIINDMRECSQETWKQILYMSNAIGGLDGRLKKWRLWEDRVSCEYLLQFIHLVKWLSIIFCPVTGGGLWDRLSVISILTVDWGAAWRRLFSISILTKMFSVLRGFIASRRSATGIEYCVITVRSSCK